MRLTPELVKSAPAYINPVKERELSLRGFKLPAIENLGVTQDQYDTIDLSDNELTKLENFPLLARLTGLLLNNNRITRCTDGLGQYLPKLATLILTNNRISSLEHLDPLAELTSLHTLSLLNNPVSKLPNYRLYVIFKLPSVKILDFAKIKPQERESSKKIFGEPVKIDKKKKALAAAASAGSSSVAAMDVTETKQAPAPAPAVKARALTPQEREALVTAIKNATSLAEIERLEKQLDSGMVTAEH